MAYFIRAAMEKETTILDDSIACTRVYYDAEGFIISMTKNNIVNSDFNASMPWYGRTGWVVATLILFFPLGLFLMWLYGSWRRWTKLLVTVVCVAFVFLFGMGLWNTPPTLTVNPVNDAKVTVTDDHYLLTGDTSCIRTCSLVANGSTVPLQSDGKFSDTVSLALGDNTFTLILTNPNGSVTSKVTIVRSASDTALSQSTASTSTPAQGTQTPAPSQTSTETTASVMSGVAEANAENDPYARTDYEPSWSVGVGCDIRSRLLSSASTIAVTYGSNGCTVKYGSWVDPYTGETLTGNPYLGDGTANDMDIDHVIPLEYVNEHGGYHWGAAQKLAYGDSLTAMNNGVYLAVSASQNVIKSDYGPAEYYPPNAAYRCAYAKKWRDIARMYSISLAPADYTLVANVLVSCSIP